MSKESLKVVCDAGPLIHLDEVGQIELLNDFDDIFVPEQVWQEVIIHRLGKLENYSETLTKVRVTISTSTSFRALVKSLSLDLGEQAALTLMQKYPNSVFLTDDAAARLAAVTLGYKVHGTIGILVRAIRQQQKPKEEILSILRNLPELSTLFIRSGLLMEIIDRVENEA